jgi:hypothetical protein
MPIMTETIKYSVDQDGVALLVIDVPGRPMNVLTPEFMRRAGAGRRRPRRRRQP